MRIIIFIIAALAVLSTSGCSTTPKVNYQQAIDCEYSQAYCSLYTLKPVDAGDTAKTRTMLMMIVLNNLDSVRYYNIKNMATLTPEQRQEWLQLARETLDYMLRHRDAWDLRRLDVRNGIRALRYFLTQSEEVSRIQELSDYLQKKSETQKP
ncbi:MAG: hypothetical protein WCH99_16250 [Verrucomicrobiota bacterium]